MFDYRPTALDLLCQKLDGCNRHCKKMLQNIVCHKTVLLGQKHQLIEYNPILKKIACFKQYTAAAAMAF